MKALISILISSGALFGAAFAAEVPQGTHVLLRMMNTVNTRTAAEGDRVYLRTESPITNAGQIVVPTGSYVQGVVTRAKRSGKVAGRAELQIKLETLTLASGKAFTISPKLSSVDAKAPVRKWRRTKASSSKGPITARTRGASRFWRAKAARLAVSRTRSWSWRRNRRRSRKRGGDRDHAAHARQRSGAASRVDARRSV